MKIAEIKGREILDSRGNPTVEVDVILESGIMAVLCPTGCVKNRVNMRLWELRDCDNTVTEGKRIKSCRKYKYSKFFGIESNGLMDQRGIDKADA